MEGRDRRDKRGRGGGKGKKRGRTSMNPSPGFRLWLRPWVRLRNFTITTTIHDLQLGC